jgi:hypothetical protein
MCARVTYTAKLDLLRALGWRGDQTCARPLGKAALCVSHEDLLIGHFFAQKGTTYLQVQFASLGRYLARDSL